MNDLLKQTRSHRDPDAVLQEMWDIKDSLSQACGHDIHQLFADARKRQAVSGRPVASFIAEGKASAHEIPQDH